MKAIPHWHNRSVECACGMNTLQMLNQLSLQMKETVGGCSDNTTSNITSLFSEIVRFAFSCRLQSNLGLRTPRITNNSVYEQIFRTQSVSDDVLCLELRTRKPSKRRQKQITLDNF